MRTFNNREKQILKMLYNISNDQLELFSYHLQRKYFKDIINASLFLFPKRQEVILYIETTDFDNLEKRKSVMMEFMEFLSLINYLKEERFINIIPNETVYDSELHIMGKEFDSPNIDSETQNIILNKNGDYIDHKGAHIIRNSNSDKIYEGVLLTGLIFQQVVENCMGLLFVSEELKEFIKNNYQSKEDLRYKRNQIATWTSIAIAIIIGILSVKNPFENSSIEKFNNYQEIIPLIKEGEQIHQDLHQIIEYIKPLNDTLQK